MSITQFDASEQVGRLLSAGYSLPKAASAEGVARLWASVLEIRPDELDYAVGAYVKTGGRFFPKPGDLLDAVREARASKGATPSDLRSRYLAWEQTQEGGCPVCGGIIQLVTAEQRGDVSAGPPRLGVFHDWRKHRDCKIPHVGWPHPPAQRRDDPSGERKQGAA